MTQKKNICRLEIHSLSHDGRGVARDEGKTTFVDYALPGEIVSAQILSKKSRFNEAKAIDVIKPSPQRQTPPCLHFGQCGACSLQHMENDLQLTMKLLRL